MNWLIRMKFRTLYNTFLVFAIIAVLADYIITQIGFRHFPAWFEANPYVRVLLRWLDPFLASTIVFLTTLTLIMGSYRLLSKTLNEKPYSETLKDVGRCVWTANTLKSRDILVFASIALYLAFTYIHMLGFLAWLKLLIT